jgi:ABC-type nitrate/sulfonate/bicarbonate transport system substrate-binding protein
MGRQRVELGILYPALTRRRFLQGVGAAGVAALARPASAEQKAYWAHGASVDHHNIPVAVGLAKGIWRDEGLDLAPRVFEGGGPMVQAMVAGQLPIATGGISTLINARAGGLKVKYIATIEGMPTGWGIVAIDPALRSVKDLKGKRVGTGRAGAISHWWGLQVARWQGWNVGQDVQIVGVGGASALQAALVSKQVDGILVWPPGFPILKSKMKEAHVVVPMNDVVQHHLGAYESEGWFATEKYIETEGDVIRRTLRGYVRALRYCLEHRDEAAEIAGKEWNVAPAVAREVIDENLPGFSHDGVPNEKGIQVVVKSLVEMGTLKQELGLAEVVDKRFLPIKG